MAACFNDTTCYNCLVSTSTAGCTLNPAYATFATCVCSGSGATACVTECAYLKPGVCGTSETTGQATQDACLTSYCCSAFQACFADSACNACFVNAGGTGCSSNGPFAALNYCWATNHC
jgi:hypothetical protein